MNTEVSQLFKHYGIIHITSSRAHPQSNGMVERRQRMLLNFARLFTNDYRSQSLWDLRLPMCVLILNSTKSVSRNFSPFFLTYFRHARLPYHALLNKPLNYDESSDTARRLQEANKILKASAEYIDRSFDKYKAGHDSKLKQPKFPVGCKLFVRTSQRGKVALIGKKLVGPVYMSQTSG